MLDKIFKTFFTEKKQEKKTACITLVRESSLFNENDIIEIKRVSQKMVENNYELTCLSRYFRGIKGLNLEARERAKLNTSK